MIQRKDAAAGRRDTAGDHRMETPLTHTPHELADEFPEHRERLHALKMESARFRHLAEGYHLVNREIHRAEAGSESVSEAYLEELKKKRLQLKDQIAALLTAS